MPHQKAQDRSAQGAVDAERQFFDGRRLVDRLLREPVAVEVERLPQSVDEGEDGERGPSHLEKAAPEAKVPVAENTRPGLADPALRVRQLTVAWGGRGSIGELLQEAHPVDLGAGRERELVEADRPKDTALRFQRIEKILDNWFDFKAGLQRDAGITFGLYGAALTSTGRWPILGLFAWNLSAYTLSSLAFWGVAGKVLDIRAGKRLFPLVTVGDVAAYVRERGSELTGACGDSLMGAVVGATYPEEAGRLRVIEATTKRSITMASSSKAARAFSSTASGPPMAATYLIPDSRGGCGSRFAGLASNQPK